MTFLFGLAIGLVVGAYSHKWLAAESQVYIPEVISGMQKAVPPAKETNL